jgi:hypothetical protein
VVVVRGESKHRGWIARACDTRADEMTLACHLLTHRHAHAPLASTHRSRGKTMLTSRSWALGRSPRCVDLPPLLCFTCFVRGCAQFSFVPVRVGLDVVNPIPERQAQAVTTGNDGGGVAASSVLCT